MSANLEAALKYAGRGLPVVASHYPLEDGNCSCCNPDHHATVPKTSCGKHPVGGAWQKKATTDPTAIRRMWADDPKRNVSIVVNDASCVVMADIDGDRGRRVWAELSGSEEVVTPEFRTGDGVRLIFRRPDGVKLERANFTAEENGEERQAVFLMLGEGVQTIAPPSLHYTRRKYDWVEGRSLDDVAIAPMPDWMVSLMTPLPKDVEQDRPAEKGEYSPDAPGSDFNRRGDWHKVLTDAGYKHCGTKQGGTRHYTRPGNGSGTSVTVGHFKSNIDGTDLFYSFSGSIPGLLPCKTIDLFGFVTRTKYRGDFRACAKALRAGEFDGTNYGKQETAAGFSANGQQTSGGHSAQSANSAGESNPSEWPAPVPLSQPPDVPEFLADVLPDWMRAFVLAQAEELQVPVDLLALLVLAAASGEISRKVVVTPRAGWDWEPVNLFVLIALLPGERKSQTFNKVFTFLHELDKWLREAAEPVVKEAESDLRVAKGRVKHLEGQISKCDDAEVRRELTKCLQSAREELAEVVARPCPCYGWTTTRPRCWGKRSYSKGAAWWPPAPNRRRSRTSSRTARSRISTCS